MPLPSYSATGDPTGTGIIIALYAADPAYGFEIQRAPDVAGVPGAYTTIAAVVDGTTTLCADPLPIDAAVRWYRYRHTGLGDTASAWVGPVSATPSSFPGSVQRPAPVPATITTARTETSTLGTATITVTDPQFRITLVEAQTTVAGGAASAWATVAPTGSVYAPTVTITPGSVSTLAYRATGYDADAVSRVLAGETLIFGTAAGPSLAVTPTPGATTYSLAYTSTGTLTLSIDGAAYAAAAASPIVVTRTTLDQVYSFKCVAGGQTVAQAVTIPKALSLTLSVGARTATNAGAIGPPFNQLDVIFTYSGMPSGTTFDVSYNNGVTNGADVVTGLTASPATFTGVTFAASPGQGLVTVVAKSAGQVIATASKAKPDYLT